MPHRWKLRTSHSSSSDSQNLSHGQHSSISSLKRSGNVRRQQEHAYFVSTFGCASKATRFASEPADDSSSRFSKGGVEGGDGGREGGGGT